MYINLVRNTQSKIRKIKMIHQRPDKIFKYVSAETSKKIITSSSLKFSNPAEFNDVFDCNVEKFSFTMFDTLDPYVVREIEYLKKKFGHVPDFTNLINKKEFVEKMYKHSQVFKIEGARISCFSLVNDNDAMWGLYADKHHGMCLQFAGDIGEYGFTNLKSSDVSEGIVGYEDEENLNYLKSDRLNSVYKIFFCKKSIWSYEQEFRIFTVGSKPEIQAFIPSFLTGIFFGLRFPEESIENFRNLCHVNSFSSVKFYRTKKASSSLIFEEI